MIMIVVFRYYDSTIRKNTEQFEIRINDSKRSMKMLHALVNGVIVKFNLWAVMRNVKSDKIVIWFYGLFHFDFNVRFCANFVWWTTFELCARAWIMCVKMNLQRGHSFGSGDIIPYFFFRFWCNFWPSYLFPVCLNEKVWKEIDII